MGTRESRGLSSPSPLPWWATVTGLIFGIVAGFFEILNTSIGWHLAAGRWMVEHRELLTHNPFTLGADGAAWLNHEWLFQVTVALMERLGTGPGLIGLRILVTIGLTFLLMRFGRRAGLSSGSALVLACLCIAGARMRFYVRPELATLVLVPLGVSLYLTRMRRRTAVTAAAVAAISAVGVNLHGGILVLPAILGALVVAEALTQISHQLSAAVGDVQHPAPLSHQGVLNVPSSTPPRPLDRKLHWAQHLTHLATKAGEKFGFTTITERRSPLAVITSGTAIVVAAIGGAVLNPWGWQVLAAPFRLARLVDKPWVPNPEWISPGPTDVPELFIALIAAWVLFVFRERYLIRWMLLIVISALALLYVRNVGLFFTVLPLAVAPALSRIGILRLTGRRVSLVASALVLSVAAIMIDAPGFPLGWGFSTDRYPVGASVFLERTGLLDRPVYNDVRFGGWLIGRNFPPFQPFIDDRNEIHEALLEEMWEIDQASSPRRWQAFLDRYGIETALLRYHEPLNVRTPEGRELGLRGFSPLWFPEKRWALVFWDDTAMVLVDRTKGPPDLIAALEYRWVRPDDVTHLEIIAQNDPAARAGLISELQRKLHENPECRQAHALLSRLSVARSPSSP